MDASSESEYVTALAPESEHATASSSGFVSALEEQIERSKSHWSELAEPDLNSVDEEAAAIDNRKVFKSLETHPEWAEFFWRSDEFEELKVGEKFAEGAQGELYHAHVKWKNPKLNEEDLEYGYEWVLKVFKKGTLVRHLQPQWPEGLFKTHVKRLELTKLGKPVGPRYDCEIICVTLLEDGRFAFLMRREHEDLRSFIDRKLFEGSGCGCGPFPREIAEDIMFGIACGMFKLHSWDIVHRDLKASNVLHSSIGKFDGYCYVADYECSVGVVGTGFWRAPEILQACREKNVNKRPELFTRAADAYSYGMTCYEVLIGKLPFQGDDVTMDLVIQGQRPEVPEFVDDWARELLYWCWQSDPAARPSFEEILSCIQANSSSEYVKESEILEYTKDSAADRT
jgi:serine/threonine protein kinase